MNSLRNLLLRRIFLCVLSSLTLIVTIWRTPTDAAILTLKWTDASDNEDGFTIERTIGTGGTFTQIAMVGANSTTYVDPAMMDDASYCYRVRAYNTAGDSAYAEACGHTSSARVTLAVAIPGGGGTVSSEPAGITCGSDCAESYSSGTVVTLTASPVAGSTFTGWSGGGCSGTGPCTIHVTANTTVSAAFITQSAPPSPATVVFAVNAGGPPYTATDGTVYQADTAFTGGGTYRRAVAIADTADDLVYQSERYGNFSYAIPLPNGPYEVTLQFAEIYCSSPCKRVFDVVAEGTEVMSNFDLGTQQPRVAYDVTLPVSVSDGTLDLTFHTDYGNAKLGALTVRTSTVSTATGAAEAGTVSMKAMTAHSPDVAMSLHEMTTKIGMFHPHTGIWHLDLNGNGMWDGCELDGCAGPFGQTGDFPVVGDWTGAGKPSLGVFNPRTGEWYLDLNENDRWDGCAVDLCLGPFGKSGDVPVVGDWTGTGRAMVGTFSPRAGRWQLDLNGNGRWDGCQVDGCLGPFGKSGDVPVVGDWTGTGKVRLGVFNARTGEWQLDLNGNGHWDGCERDKCIDSFGQSGDLPLVGDWTGMGHSMLGVFDPKTGLLDLDLNGNGQWEGCEVDSCLGPFGEKGTIPVAGQW